MPLCFFNFSVCLLFWDLFLLDSTVLFCFLSFFFNCPMGITTCFCLRWNDTCLLSNVNLIDYSLLLAAVPNDPEGTLVVGIIDYLRTYGTAEKVENLAKSAAAKVTEHGNAEQTTVKDPQEWLG